MTAANLPVERFAPSPTGPLHLGHAFSALTAHEAARAAGGRFLLRVEDIDAARCRPVFEAGILADLRWLGLTWEEPVLRQSTRMSAYVDALAALRARGFLYPCVCSRADIARAMAAPQEGDGGQTAGVYPGTCRHRPPPPGEGAVAWRLDMARALAATSEPLWFQELGTGPQDEAGRIEVSPEALRRSVGDVALARKDVATSYHLSVVLDDAHQGVTHVTRGCDLFEATPLHRLLQTLLGLPQPAYRHHRLIRDAQGRRLAKRDDARSLAALRAEGATPADIRAMVGL